MAKMKKQHYVPQFYLRYFSKDKKTREKDKKTIDILVRKRNLIINNGTISNQSYANYFYGKDKQLEKALGLVETKSAELINLIKKTNFVPNLNSRGHFIILSFVAFMIARTMHNVQSLNESVDKVFKNIHKEDLKSKNMISDFSISLKEAPAYCLGLSAFTLPILSDLNIKLLINNTNISFIASDNPVVKYNQFLETKKAFFIPSHTGLALKGLQLFFPLGPTATLLFYDKQVYRVGDRKKQVIEINEKDAHSLNLLQIVNANVNIYFNSLLSQGSYLLDLNKEAKPYIRNDKSRVQVAKKANEEDMSELMITSYVDVRTNFSNSFCKLTKKLKNMS